MRAAAWITLIYGLFILMGGIIGHLKAASTTSLVVGIIASVLIFFSAFGMLKDHLFPCYFGIIFMLFLDAFFTYRWLLTMRFFPPGMMALLSLVTLIAVVLLVRKHLRRESKSR